jgi:hypothetical protein
MVLFKKEFVQIVAEYLNDMNLDVDENSTNALKISAFGREMSDMCCHYRSHILNMGLFPILKIFSSECDDTLVLHDSHSYISFMRIVNDTPTDANWEFARIILSKNWELFATLVRVTDESNCQCQILLLRYFREGWMTRVEERNKVRTTLRENDPWKYRHYIRLESSIVLEGEITHFIIPILSRKKNRSWRDEMMGILKSLDDKRGMEKIVNELKGGIGSHQHDWSRRVLNDPSLNGDMDVVVTLLVSLMESKEITIPEVVLEQK